MFKCSEMVVSLGESEEVQQIQFGSPQEKNTSKMCVVSGNRDWMNAQ